MRVWIVDESEEERKKLEEGIRKISPDVWITSLPYADNTFLPGMNDTKSRLRIKTFGEFAVFVDEKPVEFRYSKSMELFALLVDSRGRGIDNETIREYLWADGGQDNDHSSYISTLRKDIRQVFTGLGIDGVLSRKGALSSLVTEMVDCDYYDYIAGNEGCVPFEGRYMEQYAWAEPTVGLLYSIAEFRKRKKR